MTVHGKHGPSGPETSQPQVSLLPPDTELARRYRVIKPLGAGGMGSVYEVFDHELEEAVALKLLHPDLSGDEDHRKRLRGEVRMARRVSHPNVCRVHDLGEHDGRLFVTMELVRGATLRALLAGHGRGEPVALPRKIDIVVQMCSALAAAHRAGVLHRDVKPDNVILEHDRVVLTDFGVAGLVADLAHNRRVVAGTPAYIAPEVLRGERYDQRVDIYATAVVAYELLALRQPFATPSLDAAVQRARTRPALPPLPANLAEPEVVRLLDQALARALEYDAATRTRSVDALAEEVSHAVRGHRTSLGVAPIAEVVENAAAATLPGQLPADAAEQATITAASSATPGAPSVSQPTTGRSQVRVATALTFSCARVVDEAPGAAATSHTQPLTLLAAGDRFERIVVDLGGTPLEVGATGITALFGAPVTLGDDAARAARAAHALIACSVAGRASIDTGRLLYRRSSNGPTASGEAILRAEALLTEASEGEVLASPPAARQLAGRFRVTELAAQRTLDPEAGRALIIHPGDIDRAARDRGGVPLLGRDRELAQLENLVQTACETREPHWAAIVGPAGHGKSRLRQELQHRVDERREVDWLIAHATPLGEVAPFSLLRSADPGWFAAATRGGLVDRRAAFTAARVWLEQRAARRPVVVVFEDAQWADDASLELCDDLAQTLEQLPVVIMLLGRGDAAERAAFASGRADQRRVIIELGELDARSARALAHRVAPSASADELRELVRRAGGNPFFVEELARDLRERGRAPATSTTTTQTAITPLPATVEAVVQGRLDRLPVAARAVASAAAVVGREFWREAVAVAMPDGDIDEVELDGVLAELEHRSIVAPLPPTAVDDERYVFSSELVRDVAYQQLSPRERRRAHAAVAAWLGPRVGAAETADPAMLAAIATHCDLAGDARGARRAYADAGKRSMDLFAYKEAAIALRRARELSARPAAELLEQLGIALLAADSIDAGEEALLAALERTGDPMVGARILQSLSTAATRRADNDAAVDYCRRGLELLSPNDRPIDAARTDPTVLAALYGSMGWIMGYVMTDNEVGLPYSERAVALLEHTPHRRELARAYSRLGANYMRAGRWADQLSCNQRNLAIAEQLGDLEMQCTGHINLGVTFSSLGRFEEAADHTRRALALARRTHAITTRALVHSNLGGWLLELERLDEAGDHLATAIDLAERVGSRRFLPECYGFYARLALARGQLAEAETHARTGLALAANANVTFDEGISARILGGILALGGRFEETQELLARSQAHLADSDVYESARTTAQTARFFALRGEAGDSQRSRSLRRQARAVFERLGAARDLERLDDDRDVR